MIIGDIFERNAALYRSEPAIFFKDQTISHGQLLDRAYRLGNSLLELGVRKQNRVMILAQNCSEILELNVACSLTGFIAVALNYRLTSAEQFFILSDSLPRVLIFQERYHERVMEICLGLEDPPHLICIGASWRGDIPTYEKLLAAGSYQRPSLRAIESDILFLVYTSGTTGHPKGVMQIHQAQIAQARITSNACGAKPSDCLLGVMPFYHAGANNLYLAFAWSGASIVLHSCFDVIEVYSSLARRKITVALLAPIMIQMLLEAPDQLKSQSHQLHTVIYSSAPMPVPLLERAINHFGSIFNQAYGMTECMVGTFMHAFQHRPSGSPKDIKRLASAGQPYYNGELIVRRTNGTPCETNEVGEITIKSPATMRGYWNNTSATLSALKENWYYTGDMGYLDEDNYLFVVDRKKDVIISGGENIYSREVEEALLKHELVYEVAVIGVPDEKWGESVMAYVVCKGNRPTQEDLIEHCREHIASYKKPKHIIFIDLLPRIPSTNKVNKKKLREPHWYDAKRII